MLNARYKSDFTNGLKNEIEDNRENNARYSEWKIAVCTLCFSLFVITTKILNARRKDIYNFFYEDKLISYETIGANGEVVLHYVWETVERTSYFLTPVVCGLLVTLFTWTMIYLDSSKPGVFPPTPFSPDKYKKQSGHAFHLGYVMAIASGFIVFVIKLGYQLEIL